MNTFRFLFIAFIYLFVNACGTDDILSQWEEDSIAITSANITLSFGVNNATHFSRAISPISDEYKVNNLYLFIFNKDGSKAHGEFFDYQSITNKTEKIDPISGVTSGSVHFQTLSGSEKQIFALANINNTMYDLTTEKLDQISQLSELNQLTCILQQSTVARGSHFLMSGTIDSENGTVTILPGNNTLTAKLMLKRIDARIIFNVTTQVTPGITNLQFVPREWRVVHAPLKATLFNNHMSTTLSNNYFTTTWQNFEGEGDMFGKTFAFYTLPSLFAPKSNIPLKENGTLLDATQRYNYREKQVKDQLPEENPNKPGHTHINTVFQYAHDLSTYVEMTGSIFYKQQDPITQTDVEISADAIFTVHLGYVNNDPNDYLTNRNTSYTYNIKIQSVNSIITEVETDSEIRPGTEGDLTIASRIIHFDAHYDVCDLYFNYEDIDPTLHWNVRTPFSKGTSKLNPKPQDYKWIYFQLNSINSSTNIYNTTFERFPNIYAPIEINLQQYLSNPNQLLDVEQLTNILKEAKQRYQNNPSLSNLFDQKGNVHFTVFINENYYCNNPENGDNRQDLWKQFVNQPERILNILTNTKYAQDGESSRTKALISFRQKSIQTMYNTLASSALLTAWGTECELNGKRLPFSPYVTTASNYSNQKPEENFTDANGRLNTIKLWDLNQSNIQWSTYIDFTTNELNKNYQYAQYACMKQNRDINGNGIIDKNEVKWYLASINQLTDLWIGENSFDPLARLYKNNGWNEDFYVSSTANRTINRSWLGSIRYQYQDNPTILWSSEGSSTGPLRSATNFNEQMGFNYRCVRNLGLPNSTDTEVPQDFAQYNPSIGVISLEFLNYKSIRNYTQTNELPEHHERDASNLPYNKFEVFKGTHGDQYSWIALRDSVNKGKSPCPIGWRLPNQRELALMISRINMDEYWTLQNHLSRTRFSLNPLNSTRYGFSVTKDGERLYLINHNNEKGGVRCVKDKIK